MTKPQILVTGGAGFIAGHCILHLLEQGYPVRTTVRSLDREAAARAILTAAGNQHDGALTFVVADLTSDDGWSDAVAGCEYVLHVASPVAITAPKNEDDVIVPARDGALRVLRAARDAGVKRVVLTSSFGAISYGYGRTDHVFTEDDWTRLDGPGVLVYDRSKTLAERAAWDFIAAEGGSMELVTINPVAVLGPILGAAVSGGNELVKRMLDGELPGLVDLWFPIVDVRDVAIAHALAMITPDAAGRRFILFSGEGMSMKAIAATLRSRLGDTAKKIPTRSVPSFVVRIAGVFNPDMRALAPQLGIVKRIDGSRARTVLGWTPRPAVDAVVATAESLIAAGVVSN